MFRSSVRVQASGVGNRSAPAGSLATVGVARPQGFSNVVKLRIIRRLSLGPAAVPTDTAESPLRFGRFEISAAERVLRVDGQAAALGARAFDLLLALAQRRERLVSKQELLDLVWPGVVVEEHNITAQISSLRKLLGPETITTVPGRGYKFTAPLDAVPNDVPAAPAAPAQQRHNLPERSEERRVGEERRSR